MILYDTQNKREKERGEGGAGGERDREGRREGRGGWMERGRVCACV